MNYLCVQSKASCQYPPSLCNCRTHHPPLALSVARAPITSGHLLLYHVGPDLKHVYIHFWLYCDQ